MARIPVVRSRSVQQQGFQAAQIQGPSADAVGVDISAAGNELTNMFAREQQNANRVATMEAEANLQEWENNFLYDPESGALNQQGKNSFGLPEQTEQAYDQRVAEIRQGLATDAQREAFDLAAAQRREAVRGTVLRHVASQTDAYAKQQTESYVNQSRQAAALNYTDETRVSQEMDRQWSALSAEADRQGLDPFSKAQIREQARSSTHMAVLDRMISTDPGSALQRYSKVAADMTFADRQKLSKPLREVSNRQQAQAVVGSITNFGTTGDSGIWGRIVQQESGGRQFDANGNPVVSSAGAVGISQIMPSTGPDAARMAGVEWNEDLFYNDAEYNETLGKAYFTGMSQQFDGNPYLAAAAYNAGPGMVQDWLNGTNKTGKNPSKVKLPDPREEGVTPEQWVNAIPFDETRSYVTTVTQNADRQPAQTKSQQLAMLSGLTPEVRKMARDELEIRWEAQEQQKQEIYNSAQEEIEGGTMVDDLSPMLKSSLTNKQLNALRARSRELNGIQPVMNWKMWTEVSQMSAEELRAIDDPYTQFRPHMDDSHYQQALTLVNEAKGVRGEDTPTSSTLTFTQRVTNAAKLGGVVPPDETPSRYSEDEAKAFARFQEVTSQRVADFERQKGGKATPSEMQEIIDSTVDEKVMREGGWFSGDSEEFLWNLDQDDEGSFYVPIDQVPESEAEELRNRMLSNGIVPSDDAIQRAWAQVLMGDANALQNILSGVE